MKVAQQNYREEKERRANIRVREHWRRFDELANLTKNIDEGISGTTPPALIAARKRQDEAREKWWKEEEERREDWWRLEDLRRQDQWEHTRDMYP